MMYMIETQENHTFRRIRRRFSLFPIIYDANIATVQQNLQIFRVRFCCGRENNKGTECAILLRWLIISVLRNHPKTRFKISISNSCGISLLFIVYDIEGGPCVSGRPYLSLILFFRNEGHREGAFKSLFLIILYLLNKSFHRCCKRFQE